MPAWVALSLGWGGLGAGLLLALATVWRGEFAWWRSAPTRVRRADSPAVYWALTGSLLVMCGVFIADALAQYR